MRSKLLKVLNVSLVIFLGTVVAAVMAMTVADTELRVQAKERAAGNKKLVSEPHVVAYNQHNLIRFHVIANSDSDRDQALKRKVRDLIVQKMTPEFHKAKNLQEARQIAKANLEEIKGIAQEEVDRWDVNYPVQVQLGNFDFPIKTYGDVTLPAGNYEAVRVVIGEGKGANWWCVLFPPLCFVDVSKGMAPEPQENVSHAVYEAKPEYQNFEIKFKVLELFGW